MKRFAVLGSRTSLRHFRDLPGFQGGVYVTAPTPDLPLDLGALGGRVDALYVEERPLFLDHLRKSFDARLLSTTLVVVFQSDPAGRPSRERRTTMPEFSPAPAPAPTGDGRIAVEAEQAVRRVVGSAEFQSRLSAILRQTNREMLNDIGFLLGLRAGLASADFVLQHIPLHRLKNDSQALRRDAVLAAPDGGLFLEFGVWQGRWLTFLAAERNVHFYGFDSFEGLPESWSIRPAGTFDLKGQMPAMPANVTLIKGWFKDTRVPFLAQHPGEPVSYIDVDCDIFSATHFVLETIKERLRIGTVLLLDDFMIKPGWEQAEHKAFMDFTAKYGVTFDYIGYYSMSAAVALTGLGRLVVR